MKALLDTLAFLWWVADDPSLSRKARAFIADPANDCLLSVASAWELAIKASLGRLALDEEMDRFLPEQLALNGFGVLPIALEHALRVATLPFHHRDPFDRLLAAQALAEGIPVVSSDAVFRRYGVTRLW